MKLDELNLLIKRIKRMNNEVQISAEIPIQEKDINALKELCKSHNIPYFEVEECEGELE